MEKTTVYNTPRFDFSIAQDAKIRLLLISTALASPSVAQAHIVESISSQIPYQWEWQLNKIHYQIPQTNDISDMDVASTMMDMYIEPKPVRHFKVRGKVKAVRRGQMPLYPDEF